MTSKSYPLSLALGGLFGVVNSIYVAFLFWINGYYFSDTQKNRKNQNLDVESRQKKKEKKVDLFLRSDKDIINPHPPTIIMRIAFLSRKLWKTRMILSC